MSDLFHPHVTAKSGPGYVECRCGATWSLSCHMTLPSGKVWGRDCPDARCDAAREEGRKDARPDGEHKWGLSPDYDTRAGRAEYARKLVQRMNTTTDAIAEVTMWLDTVADRLAAERVYAREAGRREGIEEAAKVCDAHERAADNRLATFTTATDGHMMARTSAQSVTAHDLAYRIRLLTPETKP